MNDVTVKEQLAQLSDIFKLIEDINQEMIELDDNYTEELWFTDIDEKVFSFKHKIHNWLREGDEMQRIEKKSRSSCSRSTSSKSSSSHQVPNHQGYQIKREPLKRRSD